MIYYYSEDGKIFHSKIDAVKYFYDTSKNIFLYYHDDVYSKVDWTKEPPHTLDFYYRDQAQRIRDNYDYVILCYSGGYDSSNILETFYYNNIKLDKIVTVGALNQDSQSGVDENHNGELYHNVFPYLRELGLESITQVIDYSKLFATPDVFSILQYGENWVDKTGGWFSPHNWFWYDLERYVVPREYKDKKVAILFGKDKPCIRSASHVNIVYDSFAFADTAVTSYGNRTKVDNCDRINFYWDPTYPDILVKQLHVLYKMYSVNKNIDLDKRLGAHTIDNISVNDIVYNLKRKILFKSAKSLTNYMSLRDEFLKGKTDSEVYKMHQVGMTNINKRMPDYRIMPLLYTKHYKIV